MTSEPWRKRCPEGHSSLMYRSASLASHHHDPDREWWYCQRCEEKYEELVEAPTPDAPAWKGDVVLK